MSNNGRPRVISLFSGAGCFDIGFESAGFRTVLATDADRDCCATIAVNRSWNVIQSPIEALTNDQLRSTTSLRSKELELLIGGPPCQPYSKSANGAVGGSPLGFEDDRAHTVHEYMRVVDLFLPRVFIIENVPQFISGRNRRVRDYLLRKVARINASRRTNYRLTFARINAAWYGVPQMRDRIFVIGSRDGRPFDFPEVRFFNDGDDELGILPFRSAWDSIGGLENSRVPSELRVGGKWGPLLDTIPPGQNYLWHTARGGGKNVFEWRARYWNFLLKLHPMLPSWTIAANPGHHTGPFHWNNRRLTVHELQRLQTVPDDYIFTGGSTSIRRQIGNGVPSALGELLGKEIRRQMLGDRVTSTTLKLIPQNRLIPNSIKRRVQSTAELPWKETILPQVISECSV